jgi:hypothetical protein
MILQQDINSKPSIKIYHCKQVNEFSFKALLYGIEEEGIPYELIACENSDAVSLSYEACTSSKLGVGFGISNSEIALHFEKLDKLSPLFKINFKSKISSIRSLGTNGARLVKKMPFKEIQI